MSEAPSVEAWLKTWLRLRLPRLFLLLRDLRYLGRPEPVDPTTAAILEILSPGSPGEPRVLTGPFAGLRYLRHACGSGILPKIAGTYEREIAGAVRESLERGYERVVDVGCGEGYYAAGYARALPEAEIVAVDIDPLARRRTWQLAERNGVAARIRIADRCEPTDLERWCTHRKTLVVCDCEGYEKTLLDPAHVPSLAAADLLVEVHDFVDPTISRTLTARFAATHDLTPFEITAREPELLPASLALDAEQRRLALWEGRPAGNSWIWMRARCR